jgi:hypothetical protein
MVVIAKKKLTRAVEKIAGWRFADRTGIPKDKFKAATQYEDALGHLKESLFLATRDWLFRSKSPTSHSKIKPRPVPTAKSTRKGRR